MATTIEDIVLRFKTVGTEGIKSAKNAVNDLKNDISDFSKTGGPLQNTLNGIIGKLGPIGLAAGVAGAAFAALGKQALTMAGDLEDIAGATGISTGKIDNFANSLIFAGGKAQDASNILTKLNQSVQDAASGNENLQKAFRNMGIALADANGNVRSTSDILDDITKKFQSGDLSAKEYGSAIDILGKNIRALDLAKLNSADNPAVTEATKNIDAFNDELDKLQMIINEKIVLAFGSFAKTINEGGISGGLALITEQLGLLAAEILNLPTDAIAGFLNLFGANIQNQAGLGDGVKKLVEQAKQARLAAQAEAKAAKEAQEKLAGGSTANRPGGTTPPQKVETPEATLKAIEDSKNRIRQSGLEAARQAELSNANQIGQIEIAAKFDAAKAKAEIDNKERLSNAQKTAEYVAKEREIFAKRDNDIAKARRDLNVRIAAEEMQQAEQNAREMAAYYQQVDQARLQAFDQVESIKLAREELGRRINLEEKLITLSDRETKNAMELLSLEEERLKAVRAIAAIQNLPYSERLEREKAVNAEYDKSRQLILNRQNTEFTATRSFSMGWEKALADYTESSQNSFQTAGKLFQKVTGGMEDAVVDFAKTGKFEFKGFMASILEDILRSQVRGLIAQLFGLRTGGGSGGGLLGGNIIPGFLADGGPARAGKPYIVGERGPELFIPGASGAVIPNDALGGGSITNVIYNINAVDTMSFKQLVARDPGFIYAVTEQGRKTVPATRR